MLRTAFMERSIACASDVGETDVIGLQKIQSVLDSAGFNVKVENAEAVFSDAELKYVSDTLRSFVFSHADKQLEEAEEEK